MLVIWLRLVHIVAGVFWVGATLAIAAFLLPTARVAGAEGHRFVGRVMQRLGPALGIAMLLTVVSGFIIYGRLSAGFNRAWVTSRPGLALGAGAVAALLAVVIGAAVTGPTNVRLAKLRKSLATPGPEPAAADASRVAALEVRAERATVVTAALLLCCAAAMAVARYL
jgi:uncharacterized membrane protein